MESSGSDSGSSQSTYNEDGSDSCSDSDCQGVGHIDLTYERIASLQRSPKRVQTTYAKGGGSQRRITEALEYPICQCKCQVPKKILLRLVTAFWCLVKSAQDSLLWSLQHDSGKHRKKQWFLQGRMAQNTGVKTPKGP